MLAAQDIAHAAPALHGGDLAAAVQAAHSCARGGGGTRDLATRAGPDRLRRVGVQDPLGHGKGEGAIPRRGAEYFQYADILRPQYDA